MQFFNLLALVACATASPLAQAKPNPMGNYDHPMGNDKAAAPTLPSTGAKDLPPPPNGLTLKYLAIGHGIQNYTCANSTASPAPTGALAVLYDGTALFGQPGFDKSSETILWEQAIPLNLKNKAAAAPPPARGTPSTFKEKDFNADVAAPFIADAPLKLASINAPYLGHHYFDGKGVPTFTLLASPGKEILVSKKTGNVKAPAAAEKGLLATGAVDWLALGDAGGSKGLGAVYRVQTAGGVAQACKASGPTAAGEAFSVPYVAQYWFYG